MRDRGTFRLGLFPTVPALFTEEVPLIQTQVLELILYVHKSFKYPACDVVANPDPANKTILPMRGWYSKKNDTRAPGMFDSLSTLIVP